MRPSWRHPLTGLLFGLAASAAVSGAAAAPPDRGFLLAASCAACHGPDGRSPHAMPTLHGKRADYLATALREYKTGERQGTVMNRLARGYSDADIALIAAWFAARED